MKTALFVQLPPPRFDFQDQGANIPLAAGLLVSSLKTGLHSGIKVEILDSYIVDVFCDVGIIRNIVNRAPDILAISLYLWNSQRSLFIASAVTRLLPNLKVMVGGPEVSTDNDWVLRHPAVDMAVMGEGEPQFEDALRQLSSGTSGKQRGKQIPCLAATIFRPGNENQTDWDLGLSANPYIDGTIEPSLNGSIFLETVRGCPFKCRYCYYHKAFRSVRAYPLSLVNKALDFAYSRDNSVKEIYLMDPTFNARPDFRDILKLMVRLREQKDLRVHTELRSDLLLEGDIQLFKDAGLVSAEIGLQSVNPKVLALAGRSGDPEKVLDKTAELARSGIDVTTGIILGLPGDDPVGFSATMKRLKETGAFSVIQPFTLAVLPGSDFRRESGSLGLHYDSRPPYYLHESTTFSAESMKSSLDEFEDTFDMELDHVGLPSLVEFGNEHGGFGDSNKYVSKWIISSDGLLKVSRMTWMWERATNPFTIWFKGDDASKSYNAIINLVSTFLDHNPHTVLHIVLEFNGGISREFLGNLSESSANPETYTNKAFFPLYPKGSVVSPNVIVIVPLPETNYALERIKNYYTTDATVVWRADISKITDYRNLTVPMLITGPIPSQETLKRSLEKDLRKMAGELLEEIMFLSADAQNWWDRDVRGISMESRLAERIVKT